MKKILCLCLFWAACQKESREFGEKKVIVQKSTIRQLTNAENRAEINRRRLQMGLPPYPTVLNALPFFPDYFNIAKRGDIYYNHNGFNEALAINVNGSIIQTFEGVRDSSRLFFRRLRQTDEGLMMMPCDLSGEVNDSTEIYSFWKY